MTSTAQSCLKEYYWDHFADLHVDLTFLRHLFIKRINLEAGRGLRDDPEALEQFAEVDECLEEAGRLLEDAKVILFAACAEQTERRKLKGKTKT